MLVVFTLPVAVYAGEKALEKYVVGQVIVLEEFQKGRKVTYENKEGAIFTVDIVGPDEGWAQAKCIHWNWIKRVYLGPHKEIITGTDREECFLEKEARELLDRQKECEKKAEELEKYVIGQVICDGTSSFLVDALGPEQGYVQGTVLPIDSYSAGKKVYINPKNHHAYYGWTIEQCFLGKERRSIELRLNQIKREDDAINEQRWLELQRNKENKK